MNDLALEIADAVVSRIKPDLPVDVALWNSAKVGAYLNRGARQVTERYAAMPGFPKAIRLPTPSGGRGSPLWPAAEVIEWAQKYRERS